MTKDWESGANWMLEAIRGSLRGYPVHGGDIEVMMSVKQLVARAVLAESEWWAEAGADRDGDVSDQGRERLVSNRDAMKEFET